MRDFLKSKGRHVSSGWLWPLVLLALPGCLLNAGAYPETGSTLAFDPGPEPRTSAIMCQIPKPGTTQCATPDEAEGGVALTHAAVALAEGANSSFALDFSPNACPDGLPMKTEFFGLFHDGYTVCLNCGTQIPEPYVDGNAVCIAQCKDLLNANEGPTPEGGVDAFCEANAHVSTNFDKSMCFDGICTSAGNPPLTFADPRRLAEPVKWIVDPSDGTQATGNTLQKITPTPTPADFDAGSAAAQVIMTGDAWVEFGAGETGVSHVLGVSNCGFPCDVNSPPVDDDRTLGDIEFALSLNYDNNVYVLENGGTVVNGPFGDPYTPGERFRVKIVTDPSGKAVISYSRLLAPCTPGTKCDEDEFFTSTLPATYPLRIDTSFRETLATLTNVSVVRIQ